MRFSCCSYEHLCKQTELRDKIHIGCPSSYPAFSVIVNSTHFATTFAAGSWIMEFLHALLKTQGKLQKSERTKKLYYAFSTLSSLYPSIHVSHWNGALSCSIHFFAVKQQIKRKGSYMCLICLVQAFWLEKKLLLYAFSNTSNLLVTIQLL